MRAPRQTRRAFTLIELLIVVAIIGILAAIAIPNFNQARTRSQVSRMRADMRTVAVALESYRVDQNAYPPGRIPFMDPASIIRLDLLTAPVAYLGTVPGDLFYADQHMGEPGGVYGPTGKYVHYVADPALGEEFVLSSFGPDQDLEFEIVYYDPSNGVRSDGDLYCVGFPQAR